MRLAFMGSPDFAVPTLDALVAAGHEIAAVYSQPPRPSGRGHALRPTAVASRAEALGLTVRTPKSLRSPEEQAAFAALDLDAAIVVAYGLILPRPILDAPRLGCFNLHGSLLPRWRGAAPMQRAIEAGDAETGVQVMAMEEGLDTGPVYATHREPITDATTAGTLHDALAGAGARLMVETLPRIADGTLQPVPQPDEGATYAAKITREETRIDWSRPASTVLRHIHAFSPFPGSWCELPTPRGPLRLKVLQVAPATGEGPPGTLLDDALTVACGGGAVRLVRVQREGKGPVAAEDFLRGTPVPAGTILP